MQNLQVRPCFVGGFIASSKELVELLTYYSRTYMFSTAMTPQVAGSLIAAIDVIENEPIHRELLWENIRYFRKGLLELGFNIGNAETAILPVIIGDDWKVREMCRRLHELDIYVNPVLYPAVPKRAARIRMSLMSTHTKEHLDRALNALEDVAREFDEGWDVATSQNFRISLLVELCDRRFYLVCSRKFVSRQPNRDSALDNIVMGAGKKMEIWRTVPICVWENSYFTTILGN